MKVATDLVREAVPGATGVPALPRSGSAAIKAFATALRTDRSRSQAGGTAATANGTSIRCCYAHCVGSSPARCFSRQDSNLASSASAYNSIEPYQPCSARSRRWLPDLYAAPG